jgi:integrase
MRHSSFYRREWPRLKAAAGVPADLRAHDLRHTAASLLIAAGVAPKSVQEHLGHSSITITMDRYGHLYDEEGDHRAAALDRYYRDGTAAAGGTKVQDARMSGRDRR